MSTTNIVHPTISRAFAGRVSPALWGTLVAGVVACSGGENPAQWGDSFSGEGNNSDEPAPSGATSAAATSDEPAPSSGSPVTTTNTGAPTPTPDADPPPSGDAACAALNGRTDAGLTKLRRLTRAQLNNTLRDLFGISDNPAGGLSPDAAVGPFENNAFNPATALAVEQHKELAERVAAVVVPRMAELSSCDLAADATSACATQVIEQLGQKTYRRPLQTEEVSAYVSLFELGRAEDDAANGFKLIITAMLQSPFFLYHWDVGTTGSPVNGTVPVSAWELASRLSYFLWNSMPDTALFALAQDGSLSRTDVLDAQVARMLADPKAADSIKLFHLQWLKIYDLSRVDKDIAVFPTYSTDLLQAMQNETANFSDYVVRQGDGTLNTLFTANWSIIDAPMAALYGVTSTSPSEPTALPEDERGGLLTQAAFLARHAHRDDTSPVHRGITVRENILCTTIPDPPVGVSTTLPPAEAATSVRHRFSQHLADPTCAGCHQLMDPLGLSFEHYDAIGAYRTMDRYGAVDAAGEIVGGRDSLAGGYYGAVELGQKFGQSDQVAACLSNQWFRYALGRMESELDACTISRLQSEFNSSGHNVRSLIAGIVKSDAFLNVRATAQ